MALSTSKQASASKRSRSSDDGPQVDALASRLLFSLLKAAARVAARFDTPMARLIELTELAYFEELRLQHPRDLSGVARRLGISLRTVGSLSRRLKAGFFTAETEIEPLRRIAGALLEGPKSLDEIAKSLPSGDRARLRASLERLVDNDWIEVVDGAYQLKSTMRSFVDETFPRRIDALNNQMEILAESVWLRFVSREEAAAAGRSWSFLAEPEAVKEFLEKTVRDMRHGAIDLEEAALKSEGFERYGITFAFAKLGSKKT